MRDYVFHTICYVFLMLLIFIYVFLLFFFSSRRRHTRCALVTGVQTCALPISLLKTIAMGVVPPDFSNGAVAMLPIWASGRIREIGRASCRERVCQYV